MNSDALAIFRNDYPAGHPFLTATSQLAATTTETGLLLANGNSLTLAPPSPTGIYGSSTPMDPMSNGTFSTNTLGAPSDRRGLSQAPYINSGILDGRPFTLQFAAKGAAVTGTVNTFTLKIYLGGSAAIGTAGDVLCATTALAMATTHPMSILLQATLFWDSVQQSLGGEFVYVWGYNGVFTYVARAGLTNTSFTAANLAALQFTPSMTWAVTAGTLTVTEFSLSLV